MSQKWFTRGMLGLFTLIILIGINRIYRLKMNTDINKDLKQETTDLSSKNAPNKNDVKKMERQSMEDPKKLSLTKTGPFEMADPPINTAQLAEMFGKNVIEDGNLIRIDITQIKSFFKSGSQFELPLLKGAKAIVRPTEILNHAPDAQQLTGELEVQGETMSGPLNQMILFIRQDRIAGGMIYFNGKKNAIVPKRGELILVSYSNEFKYD